MNKKELLDTQNWEEIIKKGTIHAVYQFKFWNLQGESKMKGYSPEEIVMEAIEKVYLGEWNWDPEKSDLLSYLKYHVINGLIANLATSKERKSTSQRDASDIEVGSTEDTLETIAAAEILEIITQELQPDNDALVVFNGLHDGLKRRDICNENEWQTNRYDSALKRLSTKLKGISRTNILK